MRRTPSRGPRARGLTLWCVLALLGLAGCTALGPTSTSTSTPTGSPGPVLSWSVVPLPAGVDPRTLTAMADRLLIGGLATGPSPAPRMLTLDSAGTTREVPLTPHSGYAFEARWRSVASDGIRVIAIGTASGGAHANSRWTTWIGTAAGLEEIPQAFDTFGGWGAGELIDAVVTRTGEALVGSWGGTQAGLDGSVWLLSERIWTRQNPAGTALESTPKLLVGPRSATPDEAGILVAGSSVRLSPGSVARQAALWRSTGLNSRWRRLDLPHPGKSSEAMSARCVRDHCIIVGEVDGSLAMWDLTGDTATRIADVPAVAVGDNNPLPGPLIIGRHVVQLTAARGHAAALTRDGSTWSVSSGPDGAPATAALVGDHLYVTLTHGSGTPANLWQTDTWAWR